MLKRGMARAALLLAAAAVLAVMMLGPMSKTTEAHCVGMETGSGVVYVWCE